MSSDCESGLACDIAPGSVRGTCEEANGSGVPLPGAPTDAGIQDPPLRPEDAG